MTRGGRLARAYPETWELIADEPGCAILDGSEPKPIELNVGPILE